MQLLNLFTIFQYFNLKHSQNAKIIKRLKKKYIFIFNLVKKYIRKPMIKYINNKE